MNFEFLNQYKISDEKSVNKHSLYKKEYKKEC
jgi:hypothetical protein